MADRRDETPPPGPTGFRPDIRGAGPEERMQGGLGRIAEAPEGPGREAPPPPEWPPRAGG